MALTCEPGTKIPFDDLVEEINGKQDNLGYGNPGDVLLTNQWQTGYEWAFLEYDCKVDKVVGKGLSTNDLTNDLLEDLSDVTRNEHSHSNKVVLDRLSEDPICQELMYRGKMVGADQTLIDAWDFYYYADETLDRILGMDAINMTLANLIPLNPSKSGVHAGSCDRAGYTNKMYVRTPKLDDVYPADGSGSLQVVDVLQSKWIKDIPLINPPRSSGGYNKYRGLQGITGKTEPYAMIIDVATDRVVINAGSAHTTETIGGNDGSNATGHFIWLDADHFALLDRYRNSVFIYKINENHPPYTTTLTDTIVTPTSSHSFISKDGGGHLLSERIFYLAVEGSSADKDNVKPQLGKFTFDSATGTVTQVGSYLEFTTTSGVDDNMHHFGFAREGSLIGIPLGVSGKVFIVDVGAAGDSLELWAGGLNEYQAGSGAGHFDFSESQDKAVITNHKDMFVSVINFDTSNIKSIPFLTTGVTGSDFIQSHRNWITPDGKYYIFFEAVDGIFYKINLISEIMDPQSITTGGTPVQSTS